MEGTISTFSRDQIKDHSDVYDLGELENPPRLDNYQSTLRALSSRSISFESSKVASPSVAVIDSRSALYYSSPHRSSQQGLESGFSEHFEKHKSSRMADNSPHTETSTDIENGGKGEGHHRGAVASTTSDHDTTKNSDSKTLRRLAQNREAARKSRLRKKAYVQQLESSRLKLNQLEQELQRARQQGFYLGGYASDQNAAGNSASAAVNSGAVAFDMEYARWMEEHQRQMSELRAALQAHVTDNELRVLVDNVMGHYDELFRLKGVAAKADVFHLVSGMWKTPAERCFMWMGGFRPSELLKILIPQLEPLTEQQLLGICNLQQSSQQAEDALSQGMEALQQSLADTLAAGSLGSSPNVANYMGQMAMAMGKLGTLENFVRQADNLRQQTLQQMHRILTTRQAARGLLAMGDYFARLRALSSLWSARPRE